MAVKTKKKFKTSFKIFIAIFAFFVILCTAIIVCCTLKKEQPDIPDNPDASDNSDVTDIPDISEPKTETVTRAYDDFINIKTVTVGDVRRDYLSVSGYNNLSAEIEKFTELYEGTLTAEKAFFNLSYFSAVLRKQDGRAVTMNFDIDGNALSLSQNAPDVHNDYGDVPFFLDEDSVTVYLEDSEKTVLFAEYGGMEYLPYNPPVYTPAKEGEKVIALTFDDGPHRPEITAKILDKLAQRRAKATFFVLGFECPQNGDILRRIVDTGCEIGNHSWQHEKLNKISRAEALESITKTQNIVYEKTGVYPIIFRPPYGDERVDIMEESGLFHIEWCVDPEDWKADTAQEIIEHIKEKAQSGNIVLMHDIYKISGEAALELIDYFCDDGWRLVTVSELFDLHDREFTTQIFRMK